MGPMNEWQRRQLDVTQQFLWIKEANLGGSPPEFFGYPLQLGSVTDQLTVGQTFQGTIALQADAWFLWMFITLGVTLPVTAGLGGPEQVTDGGNLLLQITLPGTGDELYNVPSQFAGLPATLSTGSPIAAAAGIPYVFPTPILLPPNTNINVTEQKYGADAGDNPAMTGSFLMIHGMRIQVWN